MSSAVLSVPLPMSIRPHFFPLSLFFLSLALPRLMFALLLLRFFPFLFPPSRSPIQARLSETLNGAPTIRAFQAVGRFVEAFNSTVDANAAAVFAYHASTRWVGVNIEVLGASVTLATGIGCWLARNSLAGGFAGLAITWAFNLTISLNCTCYGRGVGGVS